MTDTDTEIAPDPTLLMAHDAEERAVDLEILDPDRIKAALFKRDGKIVICCCAYECDAAFTPFDDLDGTQLVFPEGWSCADMPLVYSFYCGDHTTNAAAEIEEDFAAAKRNAHFWSVLSEWLDKTPNKPIRPFAIATTGMTCDLGPLGKKALLLAIDTWIENTTDATEELKLLMPGLREEVEYGSNVVTLPLTFIEVAIVLIFDNGEAEFLGPDGLDLNLYMEDRLGSKPLAQSFLTFWARLMQTRRKIATAIKSKTHGDVWARSAATVTVGEKVGRNDPCPCESGKKYKKCCA